MCNGLCVYSGHFWGTGLDESVVWRPKSALQSTHLGCLPSKIPSIPIWNRGLACRRDLKAVLKSVDTAKRYVILSVFDLSSDRHRIAYFIQLHIYQNQRMGRDLPRELTCPWNTLITCLRQDFFLIIVPCGMVALGERWWLTSNVLVPWFTYLEGKTIRQMSFQIKPDYKVG